jgi:hypothetical protein
VGAGWGTAVQLAERGYGNQGDCSCEGARPVVYTCICRTILNLPPCTCSHAQAVICYPLANHRTWTTRRALMRTSSCL